MTRARAGIEAIDTASDKQQTPTTGITGDKKTLRDDLEAQTLEIADQLSALAAKTNDANLGAQVEMSKSSLDKMMTARSNKRRSEWSAWRMTTSPRWPTSMSWRPT